MDRLLFSIALVSRQAAKVISQYILSKIPANIGTWGPRTVLLTIFKTDVSINSRPSPWHPGFIHEYHSQFHRNIPNLPWHNDLELDKHGLEYIYPQVNNGMPLSDGRCLVESTRSQKRVG